MRKILPLVIALVVMTTWGASAFAATADFQANCNETRDPTFCVFDATRTSSAGSGTSCGSANVSQYFWDFDDGTSFFTTSSFVSHSFGIGTFSVKLAVFCSDGSSATRTICVNTVPIGANGCVHPGDGWAP